MTDCNDDVRYYTEENLLEMRHIGTGTPRESAGVEPYLSPVAVASSP